MGSQARLGQKALVIGASVSGALIARVLADHYGEVVLVDRDTLPDEAAPRFCVPQEHHVHLLLQRGKRIMEEFYSGFLSELEAAGAEVVDLSHGVKTYQGGRWKHRWPTGIEAHYCTRTLVEHHLRRRALALPGVTILDKTVVEDVLLDQEACAVRGLTLRSEDGEVFDVPADLVVDAGGRGSAVPRWLTRLGLPPVAKEEVTTRLGYASRIYKRDPAFGEAWNVLLLLPRLPAERRLAVVSPIEHDRWMVTCGGWFGEVPAATEEDFLAFLQSMPVPDAYEAVKNAKPLSEVRRFRMPGGLRRRYDLIDRWPAGLLVFGDAVCSFNPIYSQGMSVCAMQAEALRAAMPGFAGGQSSLADVQRAIARAPARSWGQAAAGDLRFPEMGARPGPSGRLKTAYFDAVTAASGRSRHVAMALLKTVNLVEEDDVLYSPRVALSALRHGLHLPMMEGR